MTCLEFVELATEYTEGALDKDRRRRFEAHMRLCPGCETYLDQIRRVVAEVGRLRPEDLSVTARNRLLEAFSDWQS